MTLTAEVTENGVLRVKSPVLKPGDEVILETGDGGVRNADKGKWSEMKKVLVRIDKLDFPRRTHEEIICAVIARLIDVLGNAFVLVTLQDSILQAVGGRGGAHGREHAKSGEYQRTQESECSQVFVEHTVRG